MPEDTLISTNTASLDAGTTIRYPSALGMPGMGPNARGEWLRRISARRNR